MQLTDIVTSAGSPSAGRQVFVFDAITLKQLDKSITDLNGRFVCNIPDGTDSVVVVAIDKMGPDFKPSSGYMVGEIIKPYPFKGFILECQIDGNVGDSLPNYPEKDGAILTVGSALFVVRQYFQPVAKFIPL